MSIQIAPRCLRAPACRREEGPARRRSVPQNISCAEHRSARFDYLVLISNIGWAPSQNAGQLAGPNVPSVPPSQNISG